MGYDEDMYLQVSGRPQKRETNKPKNEKQKERKIKA